MTRASSVSAVALGLVTPKNDNARLQPGAVGAQRAEVSKRDSEPSRSQPQACDELGAREFADLQRRFEAIGFAMHPLHDDSVLVCRWGLSRVLVGVGAARRFLHMVGGANG